MQTRVVGVTFEGRQAVVAQLQEGEELYLVEEPTNQYDPHAVKVMRSGGQQVGYLSKDLAVNVQPHMGGLQIPALVIQILGGDVLGVEIAFDMPIPF